jgi:hypothetical protein
MYFLFSCLTHETTRSAFAHQADSKLMHQTMPRRWKFHLLDWPASLNSPLAYLPAATALSPYF